MKRRKITILTIAIIVSSVIIINVLHIATTYSKHGIHGTNEYANKHSEINSKEFMSGTFNDYPFCYLYSVDVDCDNEIQIFINSDNKFYSFFGISERYRHYLHAVSTKPVGSIYLSMYRRSDRKDVNSVAVFYSNNKDKIIKCIYQYKINGETIEEQYKFQPNCGFIVTIPYVTNYKNTIIELTNIAFYNHQGQLIYEETIQ